MRTGRVGGAETCGCAGSAGLRQADGPGRRGRDKGEGRGGGGAGSAGLRHADGRGRRGTGEQQGTMTAVSTAASPSPRRSGFRSWPRWGRWSTYAAVVVVLLLVAGLVAAVVVVRQSFPETEGEIAVPGLAGKVTVLRDHS